MKTNLTSIIVVLLSIVLFSACSGEELLNERAISIPEPTPTEKPSLIWEYTGTSLVSNETTLVDGVVNFEVAFEDSYSAIYEGQKLDSTAVREYSFADTRDKDFRGLNLSFSKGYKAYQKEFTNHVNLHMQPISARDTAVVAENGWNVGRETRTVQFNFNSTTNPDVDVLNPIAVCNSFWGYFSDPEKKYDGEVELKPVMVKITFDNVFSHHKDLSYKYDEKTSTWIDRPWEKEGEDKPSPYGIEINGDWFMRYAIISEAHFNVVEFDFSESHSAEYDWWVPFNRDEALAEGGEVAK